MSDWLGIGLIVVLCLLLLYSITSQYTPHEGFVVTTRAPVPKSINCRVESLNKLPGISTSESGGQTWLCSDNSVTDAFTHANKLRNGDRSYRPPRPYIAENDQICVSQDEKGTIFTCLDLSQPPGDDSQDAQLANYEQSCNRYYKTYTDVSNSLTALMKMKQSVFDGSGQLLNSRNMLLEMFTRYNCNSQSGANRIVCNAINNVADSMLERMSDISDVYKPISESLQPSRESRTSLVNILNSFGCGFNIPS